MSTKLRINGIWTQFVKPLRELSDFDTHGSLKGRKGSVASIGQLDIKWARSAGSADYVVYSYDTAIAWYVPGVYNGPDNAYIVPFRCGSWVFPNEKYSVTTSKQQGRIRTALSVLSDSSY